MILLFVQVVKRLSRIPVTNVIKSLEKAGKYVLTVRPSRRKKRKKKTVINSLFFDTFLPVLI